MADLNRSATSTWTGTLRDGKGSVSTESGALSDAPMNFPSRFESGSASNPEELIAAAHATCFNMALSSSLARDGHTVEHLRTKATVTLNKSDAGPRISKVHLETVGRVEGLDSDAFREAAEGAKANCPVSKLLAPGLDEITLRVEYKAG